MCHHMKQLPMEVHGEDNEQKVLVGDPRIGTYDMFISIVNLILLYKVN